MTTRLHQPDALTLSTAAFWFGSKIGSYCFTSPKGHCKSSDGHLVDRDGRSTIKGFLVWEYNQEDKYYNARFELVRSLPYTFAVGDLIITSDLDSYAVVIHSVNRQGGIVARMCGQIYLIEPDQIMITQRESTPFTDDLRYRSCHMTTTCRFTNLGLLDDRQIEVTPVPEGIFIID